MPEIALKKRFKYAGDVFAALMKKGWSCTEAADFIKSFRDADVEEVVRCKDCKHSYDGVANIMCGRCGQNINGIRLGGVSVKEEHFCAYGERITE